MKHHHDFVQSLLHPHFTDKETGLERNTSSWITWKAKGGAVRPGPELLTTAPTASCCSEHFPACDVEDAHTCLGGS